MLPALQMLYVSWSTIQGNAAVVNDVLEFLDQPLREQKDIEDSSLPFRKDIVLSNLYFRYSSQGPEVLSDINLSINKGS